MPGKRKRTQFGKNRNAGKSAEDPEQSNAPDFINTLNDDCLARIFMYLNVWDKLRIQKVCKRWWRNPQLAWGGFRVLDSIKCVLPSYLKNNKGMTRILRQGGCFMRELRLVQICTSSILPLVAEHCDNLTLLEIQFFDSDVTPTKWFPTMDGLKIFRMKANGQHFSENFFQTLPHESLTELHLHVRSRDERVSAYLPRIAPSAIEKLTKLKSLTLSRFALTPTLLTSINQSPNLTFLSLSNCSARRGLSPLDLLANLEHLNLNKMLDINDQFMIQISENCKKLKYLNISECHYLTDNGLSKLHTLQLEELYLNGIYIITDQHLGQLYTLRKLECQCCSNIRDNGIFTLMQSAPNLECLNLWSSGVSAKVLTEAGVVMRRRGNDVPFRLFASINVGHFVHEEDWFPFLIFNRPSRFIEPNSSDYSSDIDDNNDNGDNDDQ